MEENLLHVEDLHIGFSTVSGRNEAVSGLSFSLRKNETLGVVGESGSGKSVTSLSIMRLLPDRSTFVSGKILFDGKDLLSLSEKEMLRIRGNEISMIFQEPMTSLNPLKTVGWQIMENLLRHQNLTREQARARALELMTLTGIPAPERRMRQYSFQMSGGMCQRAMISMALACNPRLLIADEPTTALDVTIQAQILDLMRSLKQQLDMSIILITHDLGIVAEMCDRVIVMYTGKIMESAGCGELLTDPLHPYTKGLLRAIPRIGSPDGRLTAIPGSVPMPGEMPDGCPFHPRCSDTLRRCTEQAPPFIETGSGRGVCCWLYASGEEAIS